MQLRTIITTTTASAMFLIVMLLVLIYFLRRSQQNLRYLMKSKRASKLFWDKLAIEHMMLNIVFSFWTYGKPLVYEKLVNISRWDLYINLGRLLSGAKWLNKHCYIMNKWMNDYNHYYYVACVTLCRISRSWN